MEGEVKRRKEIDTNSRWITVLPREKERQFFFYVTMAALVYWGVSQIL